MALLPFPAAAYAAGNTITCNLTLTNAGNVRLNYILISGDALACSMASPTLLWPGANMVCTLSRFLLQDAFELGYVDLNFPVSATALGQVPALVAPLPGEVQRVALPQNPVLELVTSISPNFVMWPGAVAWD